MGVEGGLTTVQDLILVIIAAVVLIGIALVFTGKTQDLGCSWATQALQAFYSILGKTDMPSVC